MSFTDLEGILDQACRQAGLDVTQAAPIRIGENAIIGIGNVVVRIGRAGQLPAASREVAVARWLAANGIPAVRAYEHIDQPLFIDDHPVTVWHRLPEHRQGTPGEIGALLKQLHRLQVPTETELKKLDPFVRLSDRIASASTLTRADKAWLRERLAELREAWAALPGGRDTCVVHGDAWAGNVVTLASNGSGLFLDLERFSIGDPRWDHTSTAIKYSSFAWISAKEYQEFCTAIGSDVHDWAGFQTMRDIREFRMTCYLAQHAAEHPESRAEARLRVDCLRGRGGNRPWAWTPAA